MNTNRRWIVTVFACTLLLAAGCGQAPEPMENAMDPPPPAAMPEGEVPAGLEEAVASARDQLTEQLELEPGSVRLVEARQVTWPSGAIGCPEPDMYYTQALVPGYRIVLEADGKAWRYHGARDRTPFHCPEDRASEPLKGEPAGER